MQVRGSGRGGRHSDPQKGCRWQDTSQPSGPRPGVLVASGLQSMVGAAGLARGAGTRGHPLPHRLPTAACSWGVNLFLSGGAINTRGGVQCATLCAGSCAHLERAPVRPPWGGGRRSGPGRPPLSPADRRASCVVQVGLRSLQGSSHRGGSGRSDHGNRSGRRGEEPALLPPSLQPPTLGTVSLSF